MIRAATTPVVAGTGSRSSRRRFLEAGFATLAAPVAQAEEARRLIDTHIHLYDPTRPQGVPWPPKENALLYRRTLPADFGAATNGLGVTGAIVIESNAWLEDNQWVLDLAKEHPLIVGFVGHLEPGDVAFRRNLGRFSRNRLFRGIRVSGRTVAAGLQQPGFLADLEWLADQDLELDAIGDATMFPDLVTITNRAPRLRVIINHLPYDTLNNSDAQRRAESAFRELGRRPQVYAKVSGVLRRVDDHTPAEVSFYREALDRLWENFGRDRLVYGSNWPVSNRFAPYAQVLGVVRDYFAVKGAEAAGCFFWKNSLTAYKWIDRA
jgi:predicted TIM-barrel fold metal-dependent hydrolase